MPVDHLGVWNPPTTVHPSQLHVPIPPGYTVENPIPAVTRRTPGELLENLYIDRRNELDWTDPGGLLPKQLDVYIHHRGIARAPLGSPGLVGEWPRPNGLAAEPVPVPDVGLLSARPFVIDFKHLDRTRPSIGIPVTDLYTKNANALDGADDVVCHGFGKKTLTLIIAWPGYEPLRFTINPVGADDRPLTRLELGEKITRSYAVFFQKVETERLLPKTVGFYNIALHQGNNAKAGSLGVQATQVHLVRFRGTIGGLGVAEVDIV